MPSGRRVAAGVDGSPCDRANNGPVAIEAGDWPAPGVRGVIPDTFLYDVLCATSLYALERVPLEGSARRVCVLSGRYYGIPMYSSGYLSVAPTPAGLVSTKR
jgi:hypothetical protein